MTGDDDRRAATPEEKDRDRSSSGTGATEGSADPGTPGDRPDEERQAGRVPEPEPEEAPELLGERSDYPIAWDGEEG